MVFIQDKTKCCGCEACAQACHKSCITMQRDEEGFLYPKVDEAKCIDCGICEKVCPFRKDEKYSPVIKANACISKNDSERAASSSGGVFTLIAKEVIKEGGVVFGIRMSDDCKEAVSYIAQTEDELSVLRSSKYVQARINDAYVKVKQHLKVGEKVLFTGTPCQINGLKLYLNKDYDNLFCIDVLCHGAPSPKLWEEYAEYSESKNKSKLVSVNFRSKEENASGYGISKNFSNNKHVYVNKEYDEYMQMFLKNLSLRPSCYDCKAKTYRLSDISLGDLWRADKVCSGFSDGKGTSFVVARTQKGANLLDSILPQSRIKEISYDEAVKYNPAEYESVKMIPQRAAFFKDMNDMSFKALSNKYVFTNSKSRLKKQLDNIGVMKAIKKIKK